MKVAEGDLAEAKKQMDKLEAEEQELQKDDIEVKHQLVSSRKTNRKSNIGRKR